MDEDIIIRYTSSADRSEAIQGMLNAKQEWLNYVKQREAELGIR